jgi:cation diffusion facilitator family transporter
MTKLLLKLFVKNHADTDSPSVRTQYGKLAGWVGIVCNMLLFAGKLVVGTISGSVSITADAVNNLSDASSSIVTLIGFKLAAKPADDEHPFGHDRFEYISGLVVSALILLIGAELVKSSVTKILHPAPIEFSPIIAAVLVVSILLKLWMALFNRKLGAMIRSSTLTATSADSRNDVITTAAVLAACIVSKYSGLLIDGYAGLAVALFILYSGVGIAKSTIDPLLGEAPDEELVHTLGRDILSHNRVLGIHDLIVHDYGPGRRFASVHVEIDSRDDVLESHELIDDIEHEIKEKHNVDLVIHYDPIVTNDDELNAVKARVLEALREIDPRLAMHDFRMVRGSGHTNLIFDLVVPHDLENQREALKKQINDKIQFGDKKYYAVITFDLEAFNDPHNRAKKLLRRS